MKKWIITTALFLMVTSLKAQQLFDKLDPTSSTLFLNKVSSKSSGETIKGSPYLNEAFYPATIGAYDYVVMVRYNAEKDEIEVQNPDTKEAFVLPKEDRYGSIAARNIRYKLTLKHFTLDDKPAYGYLTEVFTENGLTLLRRDWIRLQPERQPKNSYDHYEPAERIKAKEAYFLELKDQSIIAMPKNQKQLLKIYPDKKEAITAFLKSNSNSFKEAQDLILLVRFLSGL